MLDNVGMTTLEPAPKSERVDVLAACQGREQRGQFGDIGRRGGLVLKAGVSLIVCSARMAR
jgi:hypothetical protein